MTKIIDGKKIAQNLRDNLKEEISFKPVEILLQELGNSTASEHTLSKCPFTPIKILGPCKKA